MARDCVGVHPQCHIPEPDSIILTRRCEGATIRTEHDVNDSRRMPDEGVLGRARRHIPEPDGIVPTPLYALTPRRCEGATIRTKHDAFDRIRVPRKGVRVHDRCYLPEMDGLVPTPRCNRATIRTECNA